MEFTAVAESVVRDVICAASEEWDVDPDEVELSFAGDKLDENSLVVVNYIGVTLEFVATKKQFRIFNKSWFTDELKTSKMVTKHLDSNNCFLYLDTPTFIEDNYLKFSSELLPSSISAISFLNSNSDVTAIGCNFLLFCSSLTKIDLSSLSNVASIGHCFLEGCQNLTSLDLTGFSSVTAIGSSFLVNCSSVKEINLSALRNVTVVGYNFLAGCNSVEVLDLSSLSNLNIISGGFLMACSSLTELDLSGFGNVTTIGSMFVMRCSSITTLDLSNMKNVEAVGGAFLKECPSISLLRLPEVNRHLFEKSTKTVKKNNSSCIVL